MPLRDHFRPPLDDMRHWEGFHETWPVMIVALLRRKLPRGYFAEPRVHPGWSAEIDVATFENEGEGVVAAGDGNGNGGGIATALWAPPRPTLSVVTDLPAQDVYEVQVYDEKRHCHLVAAVEIVSPANKDRPERTLTIQNILGGLQPWLVHSSCDTRVRQPPWCPERHAPRLFRTPLRQRRSSPAMAD
jgi:hypothetical protein